MSPARLLLCLLLTLGTSSHLRAEDQRIRAVDVDEAFARSEKVIQIMNDINSGKAVTGPQTALRPVQHDYKELLEEATQLAKDLERKELADNARKAAEARLEVVKREAKLLELEMKLQRLDHEQELRQDAVDLRNRLFQELYTVTEALAKENDWRLVVFRYSKGELPNTLIAHERHLEWITDDVVDRWNSHLTEERNELNEQSEQDGGGQPATRSESK